MDPEGNMLYYILSLVILIGISGFFSLSEGAIIAMSDTRIKKLSEDGNKKAKRILKLTKEPTRFLATIQTGITVCGLFCAAISAQEFTKVAVKLILVYNIPYDYAFAGTFIIITLLLAFFMIVFGKLLPKRLAAYFSEEIALKVSTPLYYFSLILKPLVVISSGTTDMFLRLMGQKPEEEPENVTEEEIRMLVDVGEEKGVIEQSEKDMINNIFEFDDRTVSEVMTHRMEVIGIDVKTSLDEIISLALETGYSRLPVYQDSMDNVVGILYTKDLLGYINNPQNFVIENTMRKPMYIPETTSCTQLLKEFKLEKVQIAVVVEEYGGTYGIITMEDLLETIVGDIQDEYDNEEDDVVKLDDGTFIFSGLSGLDEIETALGIELVSDDDDWDTLGAVIIHKIGHIPALDENVSLIISGVLFTVIEVDDRRIIKVKAQYTNDYSE